MTTSLNKPLLNTTIERFWEIIPPLWHQVRGNVRGIATDSFGITIEQFHVLRNIRKGKHTVSELAEVKQTSPSAISQVADTLVEKGLIKRSTSLEDRRRINLELTPSGDRLLTAIFEKNHEWMASRLEGLSADELTVINHSMEILKGTFIETNK